VLLRLEIACYLIRDDPILIVFEKLKKYLKFAKKILKDPDFAQSVAKF
jgi:hypothetical protein